MVDRKKREINKSEFLAISLVLIILGFMVFVFADHVIKTSTGGTSYNLNEDVGFIYNITINNTDAGQDANITAVNITLPDLFLFIPGAQNGSNSAYDTFSNTTNVLHWSNATGMLINGSVNDTSFWFNATASIYGSYTINVTTYNSSGSSETLLTVIVNDTTTAPNVSTPVYPVNYGNYSDTVNINVSINDSYGLIDTVFFNITNSSGGQNATYTASQQGSGLYWNATVDTNDFVDGIYNITIWANDTNDHLNNSEVIQNVTFDNTAPTVSLSSSSSTRNSLTITIASSDVTSGLTGTCSADRSGASISGATLTETGLSCGTSYSYVVSCTDRAGNSGSSASTSFSTSACTSSSGGGDSSATKPKVHSWIKITPGAATIMKNFDKAFGIKEIQIEVNNPAQNVKITVTKYDGKPAEVTKEKTGKVHKYLKIDAKNLENKLDKATITIKVEKSWISNNALDKNNIAMFKFDESSEEWNELKTIYTESDDDYDYYDVELTSFSYFAIGEKAKVTEGDVVATGGEGTTQPEIEEKDLNWFWIVIGIIVLVIVVGVGMTVKKKRK